MSRFEAKKLSQETQTLRERIKETLAATRKQIQSATAYLKQRNDEAERQRPSRNGLKAVK